MLQFLDIKTLCFVTSLVSFVLCGCMLYVHRTRRTYDGFKLWTTASIIYCFAFILMSLRHTIPDFLSIIVGNALIVAGNGYVAHGIEIFTGRKKRLWLFSGLILITILSFIYYTYIVEDINVRIVIISLIIAFIYFYSAYVLHKGVVSVAGSYNLFLVFAFAFQAIWNLLRIGQTSIFEGHLNDFFDASLFHALTVVVFFCGNIFITVGLIILNFQRVESDLLAASKEIKTLRGIIPICSHCNAIRNTKDAWIRLEHYIQEHSEAEFSHSICDDCLEKHYPEDS